MSGIIDRLETEIAPGTCIPKPETDEPYRVKGWGIRRGERALIYLVPNRIDASKPYPKGVTVSEWNRAYERLETTGELRRSWFKSALPGCDREGPCNFTTVCGVFVLLGLAVREGRGTYRKVCSARSP